MSNLTDREEVVLKRLRLEIERIRKKRRIVSETFCGYKASSEIDVDYLDNKIEKMEIIIKKLVL